jgi:anaerobic ribonucleoside-triphosphate reductase
MTKEQIQEKIQEITDKMNDSKLCEGTASVYTRVSGYYRSVSNFNNGKRQEVTERKHYSVK